MSKIQPSYLKLGNLLSDRLFRIPEYQRAYSWGTSQRKDLFEDIKKTYLRSQSDDDTEHFMAAIVALKKNKRTIGTNDFYTTEIVDGQQRITTLILLLKAIQLGLDKDEEEKSYNEIQELLVKPDKDSLLLLQTNHDTSHYFKNYLLKGKHPSLNEVKTLADFHLVSAMIECEDFINEWKKQTSLLTLFALIKNKIAFILHELDDEKVVYTVFEVLNSRGLEVSWLDRLKSILMGILCEYKPENIDEHLKEVQNIWTDIYRCIGLRQGMNEEALRFAGTLLQVNAPPSKIHSETASVEEFRKKSTDISQIKESAHHLLKVTESADILKQNRRLNAVAEIVQARFLAVAINLKEDIEVSEKKILMKQWEAITFRIYGLHRNDARTAVGDYVRLGWSIHNNVDVGYKAILKELIEIGKNYTINGEETWDSICQKSDNDWYRKWSKELRYFFFRYEEYLSKKQKQTFSNEQWNRIWESNASDSIEHIWPQKNCPEKHVNRLGNLVLLPPKLNSKLSSKPAKSKREAYRDTGLLIAKEVAEELENGWSVRAIKAREKRLFAWAEEEWRDVNINI